MRNLGTVCEVGRASLCTMSIVLCNSSAYQEWLRLAVLGEPEPTTCRISRVPPVASSEIRKALGDRGVQSRGNAGLAHMGDALSSGEGHPSHWRRIVPMPLHILVPDAGSRRHFDGLHCHVWGGRLPVGAIARWPSGDFVLTPECLFLQAAVEMPFVQLVQFGYELCALYTVRYGDGSCRELARPLSSARRIGEFLAKCDGLPGVKKARAAIPWVLDRSRSPRESTFAISMTLPRFRGGQAVRNASLNREITLTDEERRSAGRHHFEVDFYIPCTGEGRTGIGVEYYGKEEHAGAMREVRDIRRESILASKGIEIHGVTKAQVENVVELERLAKALTLAQGGRWRKPTEAHERAMRALLRDLYPHRAGGW